MRQTLAQRKALHRAEMAARRDRQELRDTKGSVKRAFNVAKTPEQKNMWRTVWNRLVMRQHAER